MLIPELNESYAITVMGYSQKQLNEGQYNIAFQNNLLLELDMLNHWVKKGSEWIGNNVEGAIEKVKDIAYDAVDAVKDYGANMKGVIVGLTAMIQDEEEFVKYQKGILASVRFFPKRLNGKINDIASWLESKSMPTFAKTLRAIKDGIMKVWESIKANASWKGALSMMAFGLGTVYLEEEFEVLDKLSKAQDIIKDPKKVVKGKLLDFFSGKIEEATDEIKEELMAFLNEKLGFVEKIKTFIQEKILNVVGQALEQFAGPVAWVKQLMDFFQKSDWVLKNLSGMLTKFSLKIESRKVGKHIIERNGLDESLRRAIRQLLTESLSRQATTFFNGAYGFEQMLRRDVPSKEQLHRNRDVYYGKFSQDGCDTLFQLEQIEYWDIVNDKPIDVIWIHGLRTLGDCQGKGGGTHVMQCITDFADTVGLGVAGSVVPYGSSKMTREQMTAFDGRFGLMPLKHWRKFIPQDVQEDEDAMWETDDYIQSNEDHVWRPAGGYV